MDQQLKQRLIGVTIAVALVVIFVPMLFDKSDDKGKLAAAGVPPIPEDVLEKPLELPKTAEDLAAEEQRREAEKNGDKKATPAEGSGYKIVPFNDEPLAKPKTPAPAAPAQPKAAQAAQPEQDEEAMEAEDDEEGNPSATPTQNKTTAVQPPPPVVNRLAEPSPAAKKAPAPAAKSQPTAPLKAEAAQPKPKPAATAEAQTAKKPALAKKPEAARQAEASRPPIKTVKVHRPKPAALLPDADDEGEPIPVPAKPAESKPKPKPKSQATPTPAHATAAKKPEPAKPATAKTEAPAKPAEDAKKKPTAWVIQAGSFVNESSAKGVAEKLKQAKVPATVKTVQGEHGPIYRVQVTAERDKTRAEETLKRAQGAGVDSYLTPQH